MAAQLPAPGCGRAAVADTYNSAVPGRPLTVSDPAKGVIANDTNVYGVTMLRDTHRRCTRHSERGRHVHVHGTQPAAAQLRSANGTSRRTVLIGRSRRTVTVSICGTAMHWNSGTTANPDVYSVNNVANSVHIAPPGVLANDSDPQGRSLCAIGPTGAHPAEVSHDSNGNHRRNCHAHTGPGWFLHGDPHWRHHDRCQGHVHLPRKNSQGTGVRCRHRDGHLPGGDRSWL